MRYFILFAHPDPERSFNAEMLRVGRQALLDAGHEVEVSNLYAMGFNPVASAADFAALRFPDRLQYDREQKHADANDLLAPDIVEELRKIFWCDVLIIQFPLYWFTMPAIMKGWFDRVFVNSRVYGAGKRYETGGLKGRRAMVATTTGAYEQMFQPDGLLGDPLRALWPIHNGILHYSGMAVLPPYFGWSPVHSSQAENGAAIDRYVQRLLGAGSETPMPFHPTSDFTPEFRLKETISPIGAGHWRPGA